MARLDIKIKCSLCGEQCEPATIRECTLPVLITTISCKGQRSDSIEFKSYRLCDNCLSMVTKIHETVTEPIIEVE